VAIAAPEDGTVFVRPVGGPAISIPVSITATATESAPVLTLTATITGVATDGGIILPQVLALVNTGLGSSATVGVVPYSARVAGVYTINAVASNSQGLSVDSSTFVVREVPPPTVEITQPPEATYVYYTGTTALSIPFEFEGKSFESGITKLTATLNGTPLAFTAEDIGTLLATGSGTLPAISASGTYVLTVTAEDDYGIDTASTSFTVTVLKPTPTIVIDDPLNGTVFTLPVGANTMGVPFTFTAATSPNFVISSISAKLGSSNLAVPVQTGVGTVEASGSGTMPGLAAGTYTLTAYGTSAGITVQTSVSFTIKAVISNLPPTVIISTPPPNSSYGLASGCGASLSIPLTFTGTSTTPGAVITKLTATLDGRALTVSSTTLNQKNATGLATMIVTTTGTHTIKVTATDAYGTATATRTFTVVAAVKRSLTGTVFFDVNFDGTRNTSDYGLANISVKLIDSSGQTVATTSTDSSGSYTFSAYPGSYVITVAALNGLALTTLNDHAVTISTAAVTAPPTGYGLHFATIKTLCANGFTIGYWKNNVDKALAGKTNGAQVSASAIKGYTSAIGCLALEPFAGISMSSASAVMGSTSSRPADLLAKQLMASEYNYANGGYIGSDRVLTYAFIYYAEYVLKNSGSYSSSYILWVKDWCDAYNNSHGGKVLGPSA
jgi:hypothetical protein